MRLDIRYRLNFRYPEPVYESQNELRVRPRDGENQRVLSYRITTRPSARVLAFRDYWDTTVDHLGVRHKHDEFEIVAEASVETFPAVPIARGPAGASRSFGAMIEFLLPSAHTAWDGDIASLASTAVGGVADEIARIEAISATVHRLLRYETSSTDIGISLADLLAQGAGVCQDYAHLGIAMLRSLDIPARYISGYLFAADETNLNDDSPDVVTVQTHAWVEAHTEQFGWVSVDPTNQTPVGERHVVIGHGRDYDDVPPVRGVFSGPGAAEVDADVTIARMAPVGRLITTDHRRPMMTESQMLEVHHQQQQ